VANSQPEYHQVHIENTWREKIHDVRTLARTMAIMLTRLQG